MNIFEQASRSKLRFQTARGALAAESLWDIPLTSRDDFNLDTLAKQVNADLHSAAEESFVSVTTNPAKDMAQLKLDILKHIIADKLAAKASAAAKAEKAKERARLIEILGQKQDQELMNLTPQQLQARLAALDE